MRLAKSIVIMTASLLVVGAGCAAAPTATSNLPTSSPEAAAPSAASTGVVGAVAPASPKQPYYIAYSDAAFKKARADGRPILLYFYASWCPICRDEEPRVKADVEAADVPIAGFRVHFNDPETDTDAEALAKAFKVPYQHTSIFLDTKGNEVERFVGPVDSSARLAAFQKAAK